MSLIPDERIFGFCSPNFWPGFPVASRSQPLKELLPLAAAPTFPPPQLMGISYLTFFTLRFLCLFLKDLLVTSWSHRGCSTQLDNPPTGESLSDPLLCPILLFQKLVWYLWLQIPSSRPKLFYLLYFAYHLLYDWVPNEGK